MAGVHQVPQSALVSKIRALQSANNSRLEEGACHAVKNIGKPCAGKPHARFDEGGLVTESMVRLLGHRQTKGTETDKPSLRKSDLLSTLPLDSQGFTTRLAPGLTPMVLRRKLFISILLLFSHQTDLLYT